MRYQGKKIALEAGENLLALGNVSKDFYFSFGVESGTYTIIAIINGAEFEIEADLTGFSAWQIPGAQDFKIVSSAATTLHFSSRPL